MMKFFRKHNKKLLAVFMTLLMIVFVGGSALQGLLTPQNNRVVADSKYGSISFIDQQNVRGETKLLELLGLNWRYPLGPVGKPLDEVDWLLLSREAVYLGAAADPAELGASAEADRILSGVDNLARQLRVKRERLEEAMAGYRSVQNTVLAVASAALPSEAEIRSTARDALEEVRIRAVVLPASSFIDDEAEFSEAQLEEQLAAHRAKEPGLGLSFGYYVAPTLKVQYLKIDRNAIMASIGVANLERKAKKYYSANRTTHASFRKSLEELNVEDPVLDGEIVGPAAPPPSPYLDWEAARAIAIAAVKEESADEAAGRIAGWAIQYEVQSWMDVARGEDGYKEPPANVAAVGFYAEMLEHVPRSLSFAGAVSTGETDFFGIEEAGDLPEIGSASFNPDRGARRSFRSLVAQSKALVPVVPKEEGVNATEFLAPFQTCAYSLTDSESGNRYTFRVVDWREGHPAESVDEVRERVETDLRLAAGFEAARQRAESLKGCAIDDGLREAFEADELLGELVSAGVDGGGGFFEPSSFSRLPRYQAARGRPPEGIRLDSDAGQIPNSVVDSCFALANAEEKFAIFELRDRASVLVAEWVEVLPADEDEFNGLRRQLVSDLGLARQSSAISEWLDPDQIRARGQLEWVRN